MNTTIWINKIELSIQNMQVLFKYNYIMKFNYITKSRTFLTYVNVIY